MTVRKHLAVMVATVPLALSTFAPLPSSAAACCSLIGYSRDASTDQLGMYNYGTYTVRFNYSDTTYGAQEVTLAPYEEAKMCSAEDAAHQLTLTYYVGTPEEVSVNRYFVSVSSPGADLAVLQQNIVVAKASVVKAKKRLVRARKAVKKASVAVKKARASHRPSWTKNATRWLTKTRAKRSVKKAKLKIARTDLVVAKENLAQQQEVISYCAERRVE